MDLHLGCGNMQFREWQPTFRISLFLEMLGTIHPTRQSHFPEGVIPQRHSREKFRSRKSKIYNKSNREYSNFRRIIAYVHHLQSYSLKQYRLSEISAVCWKHTIPHITKGYEVFSNFVWTLLFYRPASESSSVCDLLSAHFKNYIKIRFCKCSFAERGAQFCNSNLFQENLYSFVQITSATQLLLCTVVYIAKF